MAKRIRKPENLEAQVFDMWDVILTCSNDPDYSVDRTTFEIHELFDEEPTIRDLGTRLERLRLGCRLDSPYVLKVEVVKKLAAWKE